jgi:alkyl hydroperoxide reductase subunit AhpC
MSNFPGVGEKIPDIAMTATDGGVVKPSDFAGRRLVIFFYPKDDTPGCTTENIDFSALAGEFEAAGVALLGVSKDLPAKHAKFIAKHNLTAPSRRTQPRAACPTRWASGPKRSITGGPIWAWCARRCWSGRTV